MLDAGVPVWQDVLVDFNSFDPLLDPLLFRSITRYRRQLLLIGVVMLSRCKLAQILLLQVS
jgi:hypothetical protein